MTNDDKELLGLYVFKNDEAAFEKLIQKHAPMVIHVCRSFLFNHGDCDDVLQSVFALLARKSRSLVNHSCIGGWLHKTTVRMSMNYRRKVLRSREVGIENDIESPCSEPWESIAAAQSSETLHREIAGLPAKYRNPIVMCLLNGLSRSKAAENLDTTAASVKASLARGRKLLRQRLIKKGITFSAAVFTANQCIAETAMAGHVSGSGIPPAWLPTATTASKSAWVAPSATAGLISGLAGSTSSSLAVAIVCVGLAVVSVNAVVNATPAPFASETTVLVDQPIGLPIDHDSNWDVPVVNSEVQQKVGDNAAKNTNASSLQIEEKIIEAKIELSESSAMFGPAHPKVLQAKARLKMWEACRRNNLANKDQVENQTDIERAIESRITEADLDLQLAQQNFGPSHPQVRAAREKLKMLKAYRESGLKQEKSDEKNQFDVRTQLAKATKTPLANLPLGVDKSLTKEQLFQLEYLWSKEKFGDGHPRTKELLKKYQAEEEKCQALLQQMFGRKPSHKAAIFDRPDSLKSVAFEGLENIEGVVGYVATSMHGATLRKFVDTNNDRQIDTWIYFSGGIETYRERDRDFDNVIDEIRIIDGDLMRIGTDKDGDGKMDAWKEKRMSDSYFDRLKR